MGRTRQVVFAGFIALVLVAGACAGDSDKSSDTTTTAANAKPSLSITSPKDGATIDGNVVTLAVDVKGIDIVKADGDTSGKTGHLHVFVDKEPVAPGAGIEKVPGIFHSADNPVVVPGLSVGKHTLKVVLGDGNHIRLGNAIDSVTVTVAGPSLDATAPPTLKAGEPLSIAVTVSGFTLVKADGDTSGSTGHLHAFVDTPPVAPGDAIPTGDPNIIHSATSPITVTGLAAGEHTIWILAGDGTHHAFAKSVRDKVVVTVA
jgi:hypothetical protein